MNLISPSQMSADERLAEICEILARGLVRLRARQSSGVSGDGGESYLDFSATQSRHAKNKETGKA